MDLKAQLGGCFASFVSWHPVGFKRKTEGLSAGKSVALAFEVKGDKKSALRRFEKGGHSEGSHVAQMVSHFAASDQESG